MVATVAAVLVCVDVKLVVLSVLVDTAEVYSFFDTGLVDISSVENVELEVSSDIGVFLVYVVRGLSVPIVVNGKFVEVSVWDVVTLVVGIPSEVMVNVVAGLTVFDVVVRGVDHDVLRVDGIFCVDIVETVEIVETGIVIGFVVGIVVLMVIGVVGVVIGDFVDLICSGSVRSVVVGVDITEPDFFVVGVVGVVGVVRADS